MQGMMTARVAGRAWCRGRHAVSAARRAPRQAPGPAGATQVRPAAARWATSSIRATRISAVRDVAIAGGQIAAVAAKLDPADALKTIDVAGLHVTPGLIDIHAHVYTGTGEPRSYAGDNSVYPDGFALRVGVTTVADAGGSGWRNFDDFKTRVIDRSKTRVLAFLNIVGNGMRGGKFEQDLADMEAQPTADMARRHPGLDRRDQDRALFRTGVGAGRARGRGRDAGECAGHGGLRIEQARTSAERAGDEEAAARRHLHARLLGAARRAGSVRARQSGAVRRPEARRDLRRRPWRRQLPLAHRRAGASRKASCPTRSRPTCTSAA